jgi:hypothetical protein
MPFIFYLLISHTQKKQEAQRCKKKGVSIHMGMNYLLLICFDEEFFNAFFKEIPFRNMHNVIM